MGVFSDRPLRAALIPLIRSVDIPAQLLGFDKRTRAGRYLNHCDRPNSVWHYQNGTWFAAATAPAGVEITIDYRQGPWFVSKDPKHRGKIA